MTGNSFDFDLTVVNIDHGCRTKTLFLASGIGQITEAAAKYQGQPAATKPQSLWSKPSTLGHHDQTRSCRICNAKDVTQISPVYYDPDLVDALEVRSRRNLYCNSDEVYHNVIFR
ncbi:hypothetical protein L6452_09584 [Arctium lappa]|uniref:Uncharacterized protein n=1 Tax=Arctium lappa TaxID=4217 RepID=A0ACB9DKS8_ARCLA|nr:hypothetical protein L6452_09584 [Arctium lappa]